MYITIDNKKYEQLKLISHLTAQQLFFQHDYIALAQAIQANQNSAEQMEKIHQNFQNFMVNNNTLIKLLIDVGVLEKPNSSESKQEHKEEIIITEETKQKEESVNKKPTFTVIK